MKDYYKVLKVNHFASDNEIKRAYRVLAKKWHPDRNPSDENSAEIFKIINEAYSVLSNPESRAKYDYKLKTHILTMNVNQAKIPTSESQLRRGKSESVKEITLFNKMRTLVEELVFEEEPESKVGDVKRKFFDLSKTKSVRKLRGKLMDLIYEDMD